MTKLLVIGGPLEGKIVEDRGSSFYAAVPKPATAVFKTDTTEIEPIQDNIERVTYRKVRLADPETKTIKQLYVLNSLGYHDGLKALKEFLLKQFIQMEL